MVGEVEGAKWAQPYPWVRKGFPKDTTFMLRPEREDFTRERKGKIWGGM